MNPQSQLFPPTSTEVQKKISHSTNEKIHQTTVKNLEGIGDDNDKINQRLAKIQNEWDIERVLEANASFLSLLGLTLGALGYKRWFILPGLIAFFLLEHSTTGWCPPSLLLRRLGFRTQSEIDNERTILKLRRGDFRHIGGSSDELLRALEN